MRDVLIIGLFAGLAALIAYQAYMLAWTKKTAGDVPKTITILRWTNIVVLVVGTGIIAYILVRG